MTPPHTAYKMKRSHWQMLELQSLESRPEGAGMHLDTSAQEGTADTVASRFQRLCTGQQGRDVCRQCLRRKPTVSGAHHSALQRERGGTH